jgi:Response regulator receiver domain
MELHLSRRFPWGQEIGRLCHAYLAGPDSNRLHFRQASQKGESRMTHETFTRGQSEGRQRHPPVVYLVDDDPSSLRTLSRRLQAADYRAEDPLPVIFLTAHGDVSSSVRAMKQGAVDFLIKPVRWGQLIEALQRKDYPPIQKPNTFTLDQALAMMHQAAAGGH